MDNFLASGIINENICNSLYIFECNKTYVVVNISHKINKIKTKYILEYMKLHHNNIISPELCQSSTIF